MIKGGHIYLQQPRQSSKINTSHSSYSHLLNTVLDKLFDYLSALAETDLSELFDVKIRLIMDCLSKLFTERLDPQQRRGYVYGWEIYEVIKNREDIFREMHLQEEEINIFMRFIGQIAAMDIEEKETVMKSQIKYAFLLAQLE